MYVESPSAQYPIAVNIGEVRYLANESDKTASAEGFKRKTVTHEYKNAGIGPKNGCVGPNASRK